MQLGVVLVVVVFKMMELVMIVGRVITPQTIAKILHKITHVQAAEPDQIVEAVEEEPADVVGIVNQKPDRVLEGVL
jgi:hypothetical protein